MKILGLQRTTLVDYPGKVACTIFLFGCNFRCGFCYNPSLVLGGGGEIFLEKNVLEFLESRRGKLDAVCITGGEPLMTLDLDFVKKIKSMGYFVKIDTNGSYPDKLKEMIDLKLVDYIAMDIKSSREEYSNVVCVDVDLEKVEGSIRMIHDFGNYEFRMTVLDKFHNEEILKEAGRWLNAICGEKPKRFFLQGFKVHGDLIDKRLAVERDASEAYLSRMKDIVEKYFLEVGVRV